MQIKMGAEPQDSETFRYAYTYSDDGFFCGISKMQEAQMQPGLFLLPGNSTKIKPQMKEGFIPRWNGTAWDLIEKKTAVKKASNYKDEFDEKKERIIKDLERGAWKMVESKFIELGNGLKDAFEADCAGFRKEIKSITALTLGESKAAVIEEMRASFETRVKGYLVEMRELHKSVLENVEAVRSEQKRFVEGCSELRVQIEELLAPPTIEEKRGLLSRMFGRDGKSSV